MEKCTAGLAVLYGVPQGSVLGAVLFLLHTADLLQSMRSHQLRPPAHADSMQIYGFCSPSDADALWAGVSMYWWGMSLDEVQPFSVEPCQGWIAVMCVCSASTSDSVWTSPHQQHVCAASISGPWPWCVPWCWCHNDCTGHCHHQSLLCRSLTDRKRAAVTHTRIRANAGSFVDRRQGGLLQHSAC